MRRNYLLLFCFLLAGSIFAQPPGVPQVPQGINYQAVARDGDGNLLANQNIGVIFTLRASGGETAVYAENHSLMTNEYGLFTTVIGQGDTPSSAFDEIDWFSSYDLGVSVNGTNLGFTPFQSVPYALGTAPRRHVIGVPAAVFTPNNNDAQFRSSIGNGGAEITSTNGALVTSILNAPVQLPHGAVVEEMTVYFEDNSESALRIWLAKELYSTGFGIVGEVITVGNSAGIRNETVAVNQTIDNDDGAYYLRVFCDDWDAAGRKQIKGVKITYTY
jgi:hypothetical protein